MLKENLKNDWLLRTRALIGDKAVEKLKENSVIIFGIGGVGSYAAEAIARAGVGKITLVDFDTVAETNINRQLVALKSTIGENKVDVMARRIADINEECQVVAIKEFVSADNVHELINKNHSYVVDAIDSIGSKLDIIETSKKLGIPIVSSMGAGNKLDPAKFTIQDISKTHTCPLARAVRVGLRKRNIHEDVKVVFSTELPIKTELTVLSSISFVPSVAGLMLASVVINDMINLT